MSLLRSFCRAAALLALPALARAQTVHGTVVDAADKPVYGVVVLLVDSTSANVARALTTERGDFRITAPHPGTYRVRTLRIGFKPELSDAIALPLGSDVQRRIVVSSIALGLDTMRVADKSVCRAFTDSAAATFAVWEQVRTALTAAEITAAARNVLATTVAYERSLDPYSNRNGGILSQKSDIATAYVTHAWRTLAPDSLRHVGYVVTARNGDVTYYAPGLDMLLASSFVEDHCFKLVNDSHRKTQIGIAFEATPDRRHVKVAELRGTLWLDRGTSELRDLEFTYDNIDTDLSDRAGGDVSFVRMRDGTWAISRWEIRMPVTQEIVVPGHGAERRLAQIRTSGGALVLATHGQDTLWAGPTFELHGVALDSASGSPSNGARIVFPSANREALADARGRFALGNMRFGSYNIEVHTPSLDSMSATHRIQLTVIDSAATVELRVPTGRDLARTLCPKIGDRETIIVGKVRMRDSSLALRHGKVVAEWATDPKDPSRARRIELPTTSDGQFRVCGVPASVDVQLIATGDSAETLEPAILRVLPARRIANVDLALETNAELDRRGATFSGVVISDSTHQPIIAAEVSFPELAKTVLTDAHGAFRITGIPAGEQHLSVRRLGYGAADTKVSFTGHAPVERRVVLGRAISLEPVLVVDKFTERWMREFEENKKLGLGHYLTREDLDKYKSLRLGSVLEQMPGVGDFTARAHNWIYSTRSPRPACPPPMMGGLDSLCYKRFGYYFPTYEERFAGMVPGCYALVWVDGVLQNGNSDPVQPIDITDFPPEAIEAVEFYDGISRMPSKYFRKGSQCGVLVLWLRRK